MGGGHDRISGAEHRRPLATRADLPKGSVHPAHGDGRAAVQDDVDQGLLNIGILLILPLEVASIDFGVVSPQVDFQAQYVIQ